MLIDQLISLSANRFIQTIHDSTEQFLGLSSKQLPTYVNTVGPLIIESLRAKKRVSTGALRALDDPLVVQTKIRKSGQVRVDNIYHL